MPRNPHQAQAGRAKVSHYVPLSTKLSTNARASQERLSGCEPHLCVMVSHRMCANASPHTEQDG